MLVYNPSGQKTELFSVFRPRAARAGRIASLCMFLVIFQAPFKGRPWQLEGRSLNSQGGNDMTVCCLYDVVRAGLANTAATAVSLGRAAAERRSMFYTSAAGLNQISFFKSRYSKESQGNWYEYVRAIFSTAAKHLLGSSRSPRWFKWLTSNSTRV